MKRIGFILLFLLVIVLLVAQDVKLYPNPVHADGNLHIESVDSLLPPIIKIYDFKGMLVMKKDIGYGNKEVVINISHLKHGEYIIVLEDKKK